MKLTPGNELRAQARADVLNAFIYRWTIDNHQREAVYASLTRQGHKPPTVELVTDEEWLATHAFWITNAGRLAASRRYAEPWYIKEVTP